MTINSEVHTTLSMKEISLITSMFHSYERDMESFAGAEEYLKEGRRLVNRLGEELYAYPINNFVITAKQRAKMEAEKKKKKLLVKKEGVPYKTFPSYYDILKHFTDDLGLSTEDKEETDKYDIHRMNKLERIYYNNILKL